MGPYTVDGRSVVYELVGMVVHTGQASAGHYYSFIRDRRGSARSNESHGKWFKFNDTTVEQFDMTEEAMATECFGGRYKAKNMDTGKIKIISYLLMSGIMIYAGRISFESMTEGNKRYLN